MAKTKVARHLFPSNGIDEVRILLLVTTPCRFERSFSVSRMAPLRAGWSYRPGRWRGLELLRGTVGRAPSGGTGS